MKGVVLYFTQTGNTKQIAEAIHHGMSQVAEHSDILSLWKVKPTDLVG